MMGRIELFEPEATRNEDTNPSIETATTGITAVGSTVTRSLEQARFGRSSAKVVTNGAALYEGLRKDTNPGSAAEPRTSSVYIRGSGTVRLRVLDNTNSVSRTGHPVHLSSTQWTRLSLTMQLGSAACTDLRTFIETTEREINTFYCDGFQVEAKGYPTTYADGDLELDLPIHNGEPFFHWDGSRHLSESVRSVRYRPAGRARDVTQGINHRLWPTEVSGFGMAPVELSVQQFASFDRGIVSRSRPIPRSMMITFWAVKSLAECIGNPANLRHLHKAREALEAILKPDRSQETQAALLRYANGRAPMDLPVFYESGLEFSGDLRFPFSNSFGIRLLAPDPLWAVDSQDVVELDPEDTFDVDYIVAKINGQWQSIGVGANGVVRVIAVNPQTGDIWIGGEFTEFDGDTDCNRICRVSPDGLTVTPIDVGIDDGWVNAIAFSPNGDVYVGGDFDDIGGNPFNNIAHWDGATWNTMVTGGGAEGLDNAVMGLAFDRFGVLFIGGSFLQTANTLTDLNRFASWDPAFPGFTALGGGPGLDAVVNGVRVDLDGETIYICGNFTQETGGAANSLKRVARWTGTIYELLGEEGADQEVVHIEFARDGKLYCGGNALADIGYGAVENAAVYGRQDWFPLGREGDGFPGGGIVRWVDTSRKGQILFGGDFASATDSPLAAGIATWNGTRFGHLDLLMPGAPDVYSAIYNGNDIWVGGDFTGSASASAIQTAINQGEAKAGPFLDVLGPAHLRWLENQSTGQIIRFNLEIQGGEHVVVDLRQGFQQALSDFQGNVIRGILPDSDEFEVLPGSNTLAFYATGTTGDTEISLRWQPRHWSFDD